MRELWRRIGFLLGALVVFRIGAHIPVPGMNPEAVQQMFNNNRDTILGLFNMFSGGSLERMSIFALGIMPYISASIIIQLMSAVVPTLEQLERKVNRADAGAVPRYLTVALGAVRSFGVCAGLKSQGITLLPEAATYMQVASFYFVAVTSLLTGTVFLMWLGEQIGQGIGNGIAMLIFASIVAGLPGAVAQTFESARTGDLSLIMMLFVFLVALAVIFGVVFVERRQHITVNYARRSKAVVCMQRSRVICR